MLAIHKWLNAGMTLCSSWYEFMRSNSDHTIRHMGGVGKMVNGDCVQRTLACNHKGTTFTVQKLGGWSPYLTPPMI